MNCVPLQQVRAKYGLSTIENMENQHDTAAQMNVDNADIDMDMGMENAVNEEDGAITNSATDNVVHEEPYDDVDISMQENDDGQQQLENNVEEHQPPASSMEEQQPESSMDQQQQQQQPESSMGQQQQTESSVDQQQQQPESSMDQQDTDMTPVTERRLRDADIDPMDIEAWTNHWVSQCGYGWVKANNVFTDFFYRKNMIPNTAVYVSSIISVQKTSWFIAAIHFVRSSCIKVIMT